MLLIYSSTGNISLTARKTVKTKKIVYTQKMQINNWKNNSINVKEKA